MRSREETCKSNRSRLETQALARSGRRGPKPALGKPNIEQTTEPGQTKAGAEREREEEADGSEKASQPPGRFPPRGISSGQEEGPKGENLAAQNLLTLSWLGGEATWQGRLGGTLTKEKQSDRRGRGN